MSRLEEAEMQSRKILGDTGKVLDEKLCFTKRQMLSFIPRFFVQRNTL